VTDRRLDVTEFTQVEFATLFMRDAFTSFSIGAPSSTSPPLHAQQAIGSTAVAQNQVSRELAGAAGPDSVYRNEVVRTGADSTAKLVLSFCTDLGLTGVPICIRRDPRRNTKIHFPSDG
jgi:hypothetical protein